MITHLIHHFWQSSLFALVVAVVAFAFRKHGAYVRYWIWFGASAKFLLPFGLLAMLGAAIDWTPPPRIAASSVAVTIEQAAYPIALEIRSGTSAEPSADRTAAILCFLWACGVLAILSMRWREWLRVRRVVSASKPLDLRMPVPVRAAPGLLEPGVVGFWKPVLLLPEGIQRHLTPAQLEAVLAHELAHVRRRDNLLSSAQMLVETLFWFYPLVWWIGARLIEERERACDEAVLNLGGEPRTYAEGILNVCKLYTESPLACLAGVSGANLRKRIEAIMINATLFRLTAPMKAALGTAACCALVLPVALGLLRAQAPRPAFEVASIRPAELGRVMNGYTVNGPAVRLEVFNLPSLIIEAYSLEQHQLILSPQRQRDLFNIYYTISAKAPGTDPPTRSQVREMLQELLATRFQLQFHRENRETPVYELLEARNGHKLRESKPDEARVSNHRVRGRNQTIEATHVTMQELTRELRMYVDRPVVDKTGLTGAYDVNFEATPYFRLTNNPQPEDITGFAAVQETLGLRLEAAKVDLPVLVLDSVKQPTEN